MKKLKIKNINSIIVFVLLAITFIVTNGVLVNRINYLNQQNQKYRDEYYSYKYENMFYEEYVELMEYINDELNKNNYNLSSENTKLKEQLLKLQLAGGGDLTTVFEALDDVFDSLQYDEAVDLFVSLVNSNPLLMSKYLEWACQ